MMVSMLVRRASTNSHWENDNSSLRSDAPKCETVVPWVAGFFAPERCDLPTDTYARRGRSIRECPQASVTRRRRSERCSVSSQLVGSTRNCMACDPAVFHTVDSCRGSSSGTIAHVDLFRELPPYTSCTNVMLPTTYAVASAPQYDCLHANTLIIIDGLPAVVFKHTWSTLNSSRMGTRSRLKVTLKVAGACLAAVAESTPLVIGCVTGFIVLTGAVMLYRMMRAEPEDPQREDRRYKKLCEVLQDEARDARAAERTARSQLTDAQRHLEAGTPPVFDPTRAQRQATKQRLQYDGTKFNFAIAGNSGSGKSSLVNAFRGLQNGHQDAATTSASFEGTSAFARYPHPYHPQIWYDIPGAGTLNVPGWQYFRDQGLYIFDCIIVLVDMRLSETNIMLLQTAARLEIPTFIVRSKIDQHIRNMKEDMQGPDDEDETSRYLRARQLCIDESHASIRLSLQNAQLPQDQRVYLVTKNVMWQVVSRLSEAFNAGTRGARMNEEQQRDLLATQLEGLDIIDEYDLLADLYNRAHAGALP